ncbi:hypothetical protein [Sphingobium sp. WCS2017Hpa-17]|uniref:hypothetical protein n=1 Tax=Sphingobium sp. WCS2017Hpa-17 TaxID=3073638 RepID=UPI00288C0B2F|nr:hypothetical protein [Sphingobium sp. WCS2017Hpa-17]
MRRALGMAAFVTVIIGAVASALPAQVPTNGPAAVAGAKGVTVQRIKVHAPTIAGNLEGESADRDVLVALPPSYGKDRGRRYPVVYALHGYSIGAEQWSSVQRLLRGCEGNDNGAAGFKDGA